MGQVSKYLRSFGSDDDHSHGYKHGAGFAHWCPGCQSMHGFAVSEPFSNGAKWTFNGDFEKPTFTPSMNIGNGWCHYTLTAGVLNFTNGCTGHKLSNQKVPLPELPPEDRD